MEKGISCLKRKYMLVNVTLSNRVKIECDRKSFAIDGTPKGDEIGILTHAHADHLPNSTEHSYISSELTNSLGSLRIGSFDRMEQRDDVKLIRSGHILGSRAVLIKGDNETVLVTGDFNTRDTVLTDGFSFNQSVDRLVIESTYGEPRYRFPDQEDVESDIINWFKSVSDRKIICRGYSLGRAQEIELLARKAGVTDIVVNVATMKINRTINRFEDEGFCTDKLDNLSDLNQGQLYITSNRNDIENTKDVFSDQEAVSAAFTGWALERDYESSSMFDAAFPLSDHSDYNGLLETVRRLNPSKVYTMHGYKDSLANNIVAETGIEAESLRKDQSTLEDFC